jgi:hypothetical protein
MLRLGTGVVLVTESGAVPVATVLIIVVPDTAHIGAPEAVLLTAVPATTEAISLEVVLRQSSAREPIFG